MSLIASFDVFDTVLIRGSPTRRTFSSWSAADSKGSGLPFRL